MAGMYWKNDTCEDCALGFYKPLPGNDSCITCPANQTTMESGQEVCGKILLLFQISVVDPGFPNGEGVALIPESGVKTYYLASFLLKIA